MDTEITEADVADISLRIAREHAHADRAAVHTSGQLDATEPVGYAAGECTVEEDIRAEVSAWEDVPSDEEIERVGATDKGLHKIARLTVLLEAGRAFRGPVSLKPVSRVPGWSLARLGRVRTADDIPGRDVRTKYHVRCAEHGINKITTYQDTVRILLKYWVGDARAYVDSMLAAVGAEPVRWKHGE